MSEILDPAAAPDRGRGAGHRHVRLDGRLPLRRGPTACRRPATARGRGQQDRHRPSAARPGPSRRSSELDEVGVLAFNTDERWIIDLQQLPAEEVVDLGPAHASPHRQRHRPAASLDTAAEALRQLERQPQAHHPVHRRVHRLPAPRRPGRRGRGATRGGHHGVGARHRRGRGRRAGGRSPRPAAGASTPAATCSRSRRSCRRRRRSPRGTSSPRASSCPTITSSAEVVAGLDATPPLLRLRRHHGQAAGDRRSCASVRTTTRCWPPGRSASGGPPRGPATAATGGRSRGAAGTATSTSGPGSCKDTFPRDRGRAGVTAEVEDGVLRVTVTGGEPFPDGSRGHRPGHRPRPDRHRRPPGAGRPATRSPARSRSATPAPTPSADVGDRRGRGRVAGGTALANVSYSAEYEPGEPDEALLARVSDETGGRGEIEPGAAFDPDDLAAGRSRRAAGRAGSCWPPPCLAAGGGAVPPRLLRHRGPLGRPVGCLVAGLAAVTGAGPARSAGPGVCRCAPWPGGRSGSRPGSRSGERLAR